METILDKEKFCQIGYNCLFSLLVLLQYIIIVPSHLMLCNISS